jgi:curved DNA-binding protein CbpA
MIYPYEALEISEDASQEDIRKAYLKKVHQFSPEKYPEKFQAIVEAYELVKDQTARAKLKLFGISGRKKHLTFASLVGQGAPKRSRAGMSAWLKVIREEDQ